MKITTPQSKQEVEIKDWITGREAEYIDELQYEAVQVKADQAGKTDISKIDLKKIVTETNHRTITTFVKSIDGKSENLLNVVLDMHEEDYRFILDSISEIRKKKSQ